VNRERTEQDAPRVEHTAAARLPTQHGEFTAHVYRAADGIEHMALVKGDLADGAPVLVRVHSECLTGDILGSMRCDCGEQLDQALTAVAEAGVGAVVYLRGHEGRGIGLTDKLRAYELQDQGHDTVQANVALGLPVDARRYDVAAAILADLGVARLRLLSNNPRKVAQLEQYGLQVVERVPLLVSPNPENAHYLATKRHKLGHWLTARETEPTSSD
jgi:GTP cyclohydrolase II